MEIVKNSEVCSRKEYEPPKSYTIELEIQSFIAGSNELPNEKEEELESKLNSPAPRIMFNS